MKFSSTLFFIVVVFFIPANLHAQNASGNTDSIAYIFKSFIQGSEQEKIILQTDRNLYIAGEKIWFKAFTINAATNKIIRTDKNLFTDLVDDKDSVIGKLILNNRDINTSGAFTLPDSLKTGFYWLRAYTANILAQDTESIFVQPIYILNKGLQDANSYNRQYTNAANKSRNIAPVIYFFPERLTGILNIISTASCLGLKNNLDTKRVEKFCSESRWVVLMPLNFISSGPMCSIKWQSFAPLLPLGDRKVPKKMWTSM